MKNIIILHYACGMTREVKWGALPEEWHVPIYYRMEDGGFIEENEGVINSTAGKKTFVLYGKEKKGHLWWKKTYGHYEEQKMESPNVRPLSDVRKEDKQTEPIS